MKPVLGLFASTSRQDRLLYSVAVLFALFWLARRIVHSPFGLSLRGIKQNVDAHAGASARRCNAPGRDLHDRRAYAGVAGALLTQTTQFVSLDVLRFRARPSCC
jgi:branched-chain amino acid transport system permease protein